MRKIKIVQSEVNPESYVFTSGGPGTAHGCAGCGTEPSHPPDILTLQENHHCSWKQGVLLMGHAHSQPFLVVSCSPASHRSLKTLSESA